MPIYEYECPKCEKVIEVMQKFSDAPLQSCETCGGPIAKIVSRTSFQLKGTGWYVTDYKKGNSPKPKEASGKTESKTADKPAASAPATPAAKKSAVD